jgi:hypothetical protein
MTSVAVTSSTWTAGQGRAGSTLVGDEKEASELAAEVADGSTSDAARAGAQWPVPHQTRTHTHDPPVHKKHSWSIDLPEHRVPTASCHTHTHARTPTLTDRNTDDSSAPVAR